MANTFGTDVLIQAEDPMKAADFYVKELGFEITDKKPNMVSLHGKNINFFIERGLLLVRFWKLPSKASRKLEQDSRKRAAW